MFGGLDTGTMPTRIYTDLLNENPSEKLVDDTNQQSSAPKEGTTMETLYPLIVKRSH